MFLVSTKLTYQRQYIYGRIKIDEENFKEMSRGVAILLMFWCGFLGFFNYAKIWEVFEKSMKRGSENRFLGLWLKTSEEIFDIWGNIETFVCFTGTVNRIACICFAVFYNFNEIIGFFRKKVWKFVFENSIHRTIRGVRDTARAWAKWKDGLCRCCSQSQRSSTIRRQRLQYPWRKKKLREDLSLEGKTKKTIAEITWKFGWY